MNLKTLASEDVSHFQTLEEAVTGALTLAEGLGQEELDRARLTRHEIRRQLLSAASAIGCSSRAALEVMPELDADAWRTIGERLGAGGTLERDALWFALQALAPATLDWLRFYRARQPELFAAAPETRHA